MATRIQWKTIKTPRDTQYDVRHNGCVGGVSRKHGSQLWSYAVRDLTNGRELVYGKAKSALQAKRRVNIALRTCSR